jgi:hypothetical protein
MKIKVKCYDEIWDVLSDEEVAALSADELREAIDGFRLDVCRCPDGSLTTAHIDAEDYEILDDDGTVAVEPVIDPVASAE